MTNDIVAEILCDSSGLFEDIASHDATHKMLILKKIAFSFIFLKGRHFCRSTNVEQKSLIRHKNTKEILFKHE